MEWWLILALGAAFLRGIGSFALKFAIEKQQAVLLIQTLSQILAVGMAWIWLRPHLKVIFRGGFLYWWELCIT